MNKSNWKEYEKILKQHEITRLYHFTDRANLNSIIKNGGLLSWGYCQEKGILIKKPGGGGPGSLSWTSDKIKNLQNYVRVSFTQYHPMMYAALNDGRIKDYVILEIDPEVIFWEGSLYSDMNATRNEANIGGSIDDFEQIHFSSVKKLNHFMLMSEEQPYFQAEILVKKSIPLRYIKNIQDFTISTDTSQLQAKLPLQRLGTDSILSRLWEQGQIRDAISMAATGFIPKEKANMFIEEYIEESRYKSNFQREVNINDRFFRYLRPNGSSMTVYAENGTYIVKVHSSIYQAIKAYPEKEFEKILISKEFPTQLINEIGFLCQNSYDERMSMGVIIQVLAQSDDMSEKLSTTVKTIMTDYLYLPADFNQQICYFTPEKIDTILSGLTNEKKRFLFVLMSKVLVLPLIENKTNLMNILSSKRARVSAEIVKKYSLPQN